MSTARCRTIALTVPLFLVLGGAGLALIQSQNPVRSSETDDGKPVPSNGVVRAHDADEPEAPAPQPSAPPRQMTNAEVRKILAKPLDQGEDRQIKCSEFLKFIAERFGVPARVELDRALFYRAESDGKTAIQAIREQKLQLSFTPGMTLADVLRDVSVQLRDPLGNRPFTYCVRRGQIVLIPDLGGIVSSVGGPAVPTGVLAEIPSDDVVLAREGPLVSIEVANKPLSEVLEELREQTGANIVLDKRFPELAATAVTADLQEVRLVTALRVLGDMCDLRPVVINNVIYLTESSNAESLQAEFDRRAFFLERAESPAKQPIVAEQPQKP